MLGGLPDLQNPFWPQFATFGRAMIEFLREVS
jgi:hypothetical protein